MKRSSVKSKALSKLPTLPPNRIELAAKYFAMSNMCTLENGESQKFGRPGKKSITDISSMWWAVDRAHDIAVTGTMEGLAMESGGDLDRFETKAINIVEREIKHWRSLLKKRDRYCLETLQKEVPFIFTETFEQHKQNCRRCSMIAESTPSIHRCHVGKKFFE